MEIEYSNKNPKGYAYSFSDWEQKLIAKSLAPEIKKLEKKIVAIKNNPKNEGQVTYQDQIRECAQGIRMIEEIIQNFSA